MKNRDVGILIVVIALLIGFITLSFNKALSEIVSESCSHGTSCPMWGTIRFQTNVSISIMVFVAAVGIYMIFFTEDGAARTGAKKISVSEYRDVLKSLGRDEKKVFTIILENNGSVPQSSIVKNTQFGKVKISRILDGLEGRGLTERRRRGMSNVVVLKH